MGVGNLVSTLSLEGLTALDVDGRAMPRLAERWTWERDGLQLRVDLKPDIVLHDGTPLTATLAADLLRAAVARPASQLLFTSLRAISDIHPDGERTIVIDLREHAAFLPEDLELPLSVTHGQTQAGTGPYQVISRDDTQVVMQRFDRYHAGLPNIARVVIRPFGPLRTAWVSLLRGDVDMVTSVPPDAVEFIQNDEVNVISHQRRYQFLAGFNSAHAPFDAAAVRRALNHAVDRQALIDSALGGRGTPATGPLWPKHWAYDAGVAGYVYDPRLAVSLLDAAGYHPQVVDGRPGVRLRFTCLIPENFSTIERVALVLQKQLYMVGVDMQFEVVPIQEFDTRVRDGRFEAMLIGVIGGPSFGRAYNFWGSTRNVKGMNVFGYESAEAERFFGVLRTSTNEAAVRSATRNLQRVLIEDPPALFLAWEERARAVRREFRVVREEGGDPISTIWRWNEPAAGGVTRSR